MTKKNGERANWSGQMAFVLAAAASAVGLGNLWRFPASAATYGGGIFILVYIALFFVFGVFLMIVLPMPEPMPLPILFSAVLAPSAGLSS